MAKKVVRGPERIALRYETVAVPPEQGGGFVSLYVNLPGVVGVGATADESERALVDVANQALRWGTITAADVRRALNRDTGGAA